MSICMYIYICTHHLFTSKSLINIKSVYIYKYVIDACKSFILKCQLVAAHLLLHWQARPGCSSPVSIPSWALSPGCGSRWKWRGTRAWDPGEMPCQCCQATYGRSHKGYPPNHPVYWSFLVINLMNHSFLRYPPGWQPPICIRPEM